MYAHSQLRPLGAMGCMNPLRDPFIGGLHHSHNGRMLDPRLAHQGRYSGNSDQSLYHGHGNYPEAGSGPRPGPGHPFANAAAYRRHQVRGQLHEGAPQRVWQNSASPYQQGHLPELMRGPPNGSAGMAELHHAAGQQQATFRQAGPELNRPNTAEDSKSPPESGASVQEFHNSFKPWWRNWMM